MNEMEAFAEEFWRWRRHASFRSGDDIPRIPRDLDWTPQFAPDDIALHLDELRAFARIWRDLDVSGEPVSARVDYRLLGSAIARGYWEMEIVRAWHEDPLFLLNQAIGPFFDLLLTPPPFDEGRRAAIVHVLRMVPDQLETAKRNLSDSGYSQLADVAVDSLATIEDDWEYSIGGLSAYFPVDERDELAEIARPAGAALVGYREWLAAERHRMRPVAPVGRDAFIWFLRNVALIAQDPEDFVTAAEQEYRRAVAWQTVAQAGAPITESSFGSAEQECMAESAAMDGVSEFAETHRILSQPDTYGRYLFAPMPRYLERLEWLGVTDDLSDEYRPHTDGISYIPEPTGDLPYFYRANAMDPRLGIVHEGAHYQQLVRAWDHEDPIRRRYYDSVPHEGIAFYNEEMMLQAGLFKDRRDSQVFVHNFMRLRALRVIADVKLATGEFTLDEAARFFVERVPMDEGTAVGESALYQSTAGLAMSYLVGKLQLIALLADASAREGFVLQDFHDWVWRNGNVPFSLQRWELLGDASETDRLGVDVLAETLARSPGREV